MNRVASSERIQFILNTGDSLTHLDDEAWKTQWANIYPEQSELGRLTWFGVLGNRDYQNKGIKEGYLKSKDKWKIDDFFWSHRMLANNRELAFIHIDTNFLAYGSNGEVGNK